MPSPETRTRARDGAILAEDPAPVVGVEGTTASIRMLPVVSNPVDLSLSHVVRKRTTGRSVAATLTRALSLGISL